MSVPEREQLSSVSFETHEVKNQVPPLVGHDVFGQDQALVEAVRREGGGWAEDSLRSLGQKAGTAEAQQWAQLANEYTPKLKTHDRYGHRVDEVEFHPAYHELMKVSVSHGLGAFPELGAKDAVLELLAVSFEPGEAPGGVLAFAFAGGGDLKVVVECVDAVLADLSEPWSTPRAPGHLE